MKKNWLKEYFTFTWKERIGILVLIAISLLVFVLPPMFHREESVPEVWLKKANALNHKEGLQLRDTARRETSEVIAKPRFYFDPNDTSIDDWIKLGVSERTAATIQNYLAKGGHFRQAEDLGKIYGLPKEMADQLIPFVKFRNGEGNRRRVYYTANENFYRKAKEREADSSKFIRYKNYNTENDARPDGSWFRKKEIKNVNINHADSADWEALPGIGPSLAARVVKYRGRLGGFMDVNQVAETYGLPDSTFRKIEPFLRMDVVPLMQIDLNQSDVMTLKNHPYIGWSVANALVRYRQQHGDFSTVESINDVAAITPDHAKKLIPYLTVKKNNIQENDLSQNLE